jgi:hypothetical protein
MSDQLRQRERRLRTRPVRYGFEVLQGNTRFVLKSLKRSLT